MSKKKKVIYVVSCVQHSLVFQWTGIGLAKSCDFTLVSLNPIVSGLEKDLKAGGVNVVSIVYKSTWDLPIAFLKLLWLFIRKRPDVVHTHLFDASLAGLAASWVLRTRKRIYTRHTSTFHHDYLPSGVKYDRICNFFSTHIVSLSQATDYTLIRLENVKDDKVVRIPHGFVFDHFMDPSPARIEEVRIRWDIPATGPRVGVVARHIKWKGIQYVIPAFKKLIVQHPEAVLILANAVGPFQQEVLGLISEIPRENYVLIPFEEDMPSLYHLFDLYVHVPVDLYCEAYGQTYIEALACRLPSVFTLSGIAAEFVEDEVHALVVDYRNSAAIQRAMERIVSDKPLREQLSANGSEYVLAHFGIQPILDRLLNVYHG